MIGLALAIPGCGGGAVDWSPGSAVAVLSLDDGTSVTFEGGTCERGSLDSGRDSYHLNVGEPGADGDDAIIGLGVELAGGATVAGDGSGNGVQVDHGGGRWGLASGPSARRFDDDLGGGTVELMGIKTLGEDADPRGGTLQFTC